MNELQILTLVTVLTSLMWIPYILARIHQQGLLVTVGYPVAPPAPYAWASRAHKAHINAVENLVLFAALVMTAYQMNAMGAVSLLAAQLFLAVRVIHYLAYLLAIPWVRTLAFFTGFAAQLMLAWTIFNHQT